MTKRVWVWTIETDIVAHHACGELRDIRQDEILTFDAALGQSIERCFRDDPPIRQIAAMRIEPVELRVGLLWPLGGLLGPLEGFF